MARRKFVMAPDAAARRVECASYDFNEGAPTCKALNRPWCLAVGESPLTCSFRTPPAQTQEKKRRGKKET